MITLSNVDELQASEAALEKIKYSYPELFNKLLHVVALTRALQFKYQFMGTLIMDENHNEYTPEFVMPSVIELYIEEVQKLKDDPNIQVLLQTFSQSKNIGYAKISMLVLGKSPESLLGASCIK
ncbi:hypothetical protein P9443_22735 [Peribacillus frigoritolerans]|uniref:hypothetical protein n=1 Tax=Peribacillus frigoritolerans TaxID=450367 RepID=UPI00222696F1|nr:hypothetical protein [Peribacillus frigoritolerans]MEB2490891.1 hypothetical protein [Peribacillus frigoritolerans]MED4635689.1 hypothetical protein [Peribacillus frigoritolerans]MED4692974.1 hypothetical protein [Peribacillus frigoritolerans]UYY99689.1 hypothetical protein OJ967_03815 [Peribacillus frigoritolerans]